MVYDFDILEHCRKVRADHGPPYTCPVEKCGRNYKSVVGLQYHLKSFDHDNPQPTPPPPTPSTPKNKKGRNRPVKIVATPVVVTEPLTYEEAQKMVQVEVDGNVVRLNINEPLELLSLQDLPENVEILSPQVKEEPKKEILPALPEASFQLLSDYNICDAPPRPNAYIRFIEKSAEELDGEVEYDVDEEDTAWLAIMNKKREESNLPPVSVDSLELLMDRFEKESYFQASVNGQQGAGVVDDDAVCCICMDGECQNTNVILFCDMCNLAVHQDCYGVPYIPEGQWLCRRCLQSPSRAVDCVLCPNQGGAFKQTDRGDWAHVVCALWIPEVRFANTVFLEPIDSIETIPAARWRLTCYVCKQKSVGACIQCHKSSCYSAFHVTCAQQAGLYMKMDTVKNTNDTQPVMVQKIAYCDTHAPAEHAEELAAAATASASSDSNSPNSTSGSGGTKKGVDGKDKMKQARKILAKKKGSVPVILIPTIPPERIQEISSLVQIQKRAPFIQRLIAYWMLKRQFRNGVPLLRRLQSIQGGVRDSGMSNVDTLELCRQLKYWQCLRQDLERARLLCELVRKREKTKVELIKSSAHRNGRILDPSESIHSASRKHFAVMADESGQLHLINLRQSPGEVEVSLDDMEVTLYTWDNVKDGFEVDVHNFNGEIASPLFDPANPIVITTHGWIGNAMSNTNRLTRDGILAHNKANVFVVAWERPANMFYTFAVEAMPKIAVFATEFVNKLTEHYGLSGDDVMLVGQSLGGQMVGRMGSAMTSKPRKIVALDPAGLLFHADDPANCLDEADGQQVHVIHTNGGMLGMRSSLGHADYYPNGGGMRQPGCGSDLVGTCAHYRAYYLWGESLLTGGFRAVKCDSYESFKDGKCEDNEQSFMGQYDIDTNARGDYFLDTNGETPFAQN